MKLNKSLFVLLTCIFTASLMSACKPAVIDGYTDKVSYSEMDTASVFINAKKVFHDFELKVTSINGDLVKTIKTSIEPQFARNDKPYENGFGYKVSAKIPIKGLKSGVYLVGDKIPLIVKPSKQYDIIVLYSSNTENAYNEFGGKSTYSSFTGDDKPAQVVSFLRPTILPFHATEFLKWIATQQQYNIGYIADVDMDNYNNIADAQLLIIPGHSEYWTRTARENFDRFVQNGNSALILSGNTMWWQVRYNNQQQMFSYRNVIDDTIADPDLKTIIWDDTSLNYPIAGSIGLDFNYGGYGRREDKGWDGYKITSPSHPILKNSELKMNDIISLPTDEYDGGKLLFSADSSEVKIENTNGFYNYELIGYDLGSRKSYSNGAWIIMQKTETSGRIINTGSTNWCAREGMEGEDADLIKLITLNMIDFLLK